MFSKAFLKDLGERSIWTFVQAFVAAVSILLGKQVLESGVDGLDVRTVPWLTVLSFAVGAGILAVVKGVGAYMNNPATGASTGTTEPVAVTPAPDANTAITDGAGIPAIEPDEDVDTSEVDVEPLSSILTGK